MLRTVKVYKQQHRKTKTSKQIKDGQAALRQEWYQAYEKKEAEFLKNQQVQQAEEEGLLKGARRVSCPETYFSLSC